MIVCGKVISVRETCDGNQVIIECPDTTVIILVGSKSVLMHSFTVGRTVALDVHIGRN